MNRATQGSLAGSATLGWMITIPSGLKAATKIFIPQIRPADHPRNLSGWVMSLRKLRHPFQLLCRDFHDFTILPYDQWKLQGAVLSPYVFGGAAHGAFCAYNKRRDLLGFA